MGNGVHSPGMYLLVQGDHEHVLAEVEVFKKLASDLKSLLPIKPGAVDERYLILVDHWMVFLSRQLSLLQLELTLFSPFSLLAGKWR